MNRRNWTGLALVLVCLLVLVLPARADGPETYSYYGGSQVLVSTWEGAQGEEPNPGSRNRTPVQIYNSGCSGRVDVTVDGNQIEMTWNPFGGDMPCVPCTDPIFNPLGPLTFTGHIAEGGIGKVRGAEFDMVLQPDGALGTIIERFEAVTGCTVQSGSLPAIRGFWTPGVQGGLVVSWAAHCDDVFGTEVPNGQAQWMWGFLGWAPSE
jgi:hypothetical protein